MSVRIETNDIWVVLVIDTIDSDVDTRVVPIKDRLGVKVLAIVIMNFKSDDIKENNEMVNALHNRGSYNYALKNLDFDLKIRTTISCKTVH